MIAVDTLTAALLSATLSLAGVPSPSDQATPPTAPVTPQVVVTDHERPVTRIFHNLGRDLKDFPALETAAIVGVGGLAAAIAHRSDSRVNRWTLDHPAPAIADVGDLVGDGFVQGGLAIGTWAVGALAQDRKVAHVGSDLIRAQMLNMVTTWTLKLTVNRTRPSGGSHAFPSGHSSASFTTAGVLARHFGWKAGVPAYAGAGFIAWSRVRQRNHWVSDTVFGAALGTAAAWAITRGHNSASWSITPVVTAGGGALLVRW